MNLHDPENALGPAYEEPDADPAETRAERMARLAAGMIAAGVSSRQAERILAQHPLDDVERQLRWLPYREARKKASLLVAAIDRDYEAPANLPPDAW